MPVPFRPVHYTNVELVVLLKLWILLFGGFSSPCVASFRLEHTSLNITCLLHYVSFMSSIVIQFLKKKIIYTHNAGCTLADI